MNGMHSKLDKASWYHGWRWHYLSYV